FVRKLVPPWAHFVAALMVALGTLFSSFWILAANSWMPRATGGQPWISIRSCCRACSSPGCGMASYIAILEGVHLVTGRSVYLRISMYWIRIFSVAFGVGVVTGVIMPFQIGTNWSRYADTAGNVLGPLFAYEALTAFFLEAAFLGVLL